MKVTIEKSELMAGINRALKAVPSKTTMPIMECFLIEVSGNDVIITANDFELGIETHITGMALEDGKIALNAKMLADIVKKMPNDGIYLETDSKNITLKCKKCVFQIPGMNPNDFTPIQIIEKKNGIVMKQKLFRDMIKKTIFAVAKNENNKMMTGVNLRIKDGIMRMATVDGHRIALREESISYTDSVNVTIPGKSMEEVAKLLSDGDEEMRIYLDENRILMEIGSTVVTTRLLEGIFFDIDRIISYDWTTKIKADRSQLIAAIDRAALFIKPEDKKPVVFSMNDEHEVTIEGNSTFGSVKEKMDVERDGKDLRIAFNPYFLLECMKLIEEEKIEWCLINPKSPCFIRNEELGYLYLVLPVNIH